MNLQHHPLADRWWNPVACYAQVGAHLAPHYVVKGQRLTLGRCS